MFGLHYLKGWSKTQATRALSSAEAELYATVKASAEVIGMISIYQDFGIAIHGSVLGEANAALGMIRRKGIGKTRHIDTSFLWVQEKNASKEIKYGKIQGKDNPADLFTKFLSGDEIDKHMTAMNFEYKSGHDGIALTIKAQVAQVPIVQILRYLCSTATCYPPPSKACDNSRLRKEPVALHAMA